MQVCCQAVHSVSGLTSPRPTAELPEQCAEAARLDEAIRANLKELGCGG